MKKNFDFYEKRGRKLLPEKYQKAMKFTFLLLFLSFFRLSAMFSQENLLNLTMENASIKSVLKEIEKQTEYTFLYDNSKINVTREVSVNFKNEIIENVLDKLFTGTEITFRIEGKQIILDVRVANNQSEEIIVKGKVIDQESNEPIPGVAIIIKGTTKGTTTDANGKFQLTVPDVNAVLVFNSIEYLSEEIPVGNNTLINASMVPDIQRLNEVIVIGYGTQRKKELTSAITNVKSDEFNKGAITQSPLQAIQGKIAGLAISKGNGADPTQSVQMQIRGVATLSGNKSPLVVIDGIPGGNLNTVSPEDIESIDVLRDGSAAAIYGSRGTNGVVLVTTKQGKAGVQTFEYSAYAYSEQLAKKPDMLTADEYREVQPLNDFGSSTDWLDEITQSPISQVHNFAVSGGKDQTKYYTSINYRDLNGIVKRSYNKILNARLSINTSGLKGKFNVQAMISGTSSKYRPTDYAVYQHAFEMNPTLPVTNPDGTYAEVGGAEVLNPVMMINTREDDQQITNILSNIRATLEILPGLKLSVMGAMQKYNWLQGYYEYQNRYTGSTSLNGSATRADSNNIERTFESTLNFSHMFSKHSMNLMVGYSYQDNVGESFGAHNYNFINDAFLYNNLDAGLHLNSPDGSYATNDVYSNKSSSILIAFFGRAMWSYNDKYMASLSVRREGSSKFGTNNQWGTFPAISVGWRISKESFMQNIAWLSDLKLRAGFGITGNQGIQPYQAQLTYKSTEPVGPYKGQYYPGLAANNNNNPDLKWEQKNETNIGLDVGLFQNRLMANIDLYDRTTKGALWEYPVATPPYDAPTYWDNVGEIQNRGIELGINAIPIKRSKLIWTTNFNISYNKNKVITIAGSNVSTGYVDFENVGSPNLTGVYAFRLQDGQPIGNMYGYAFAGVDSTGKWQFWADSSNTEKVYLADAKQENKRIIGNGLPKYWLGFTNNFTYGDFDLSIMMRGAFGFDILNVQRLYFENQKQLPRNVYKDALDSPVIDDPAYSDYYIEKGDYLKIDNVTLGYTPRLKTTIIQRIRLYISGSNLYTITKYKGTDPELPIEGFAPGMDRRAVYPSTRIFTLGLNVIF